MAAPRIYAADNLTQYAYDGAIAVPDGAFMYHTGDDAKPATSQADAGTEDLNQRTFAAAFCGVCRDAKVAASPAGMILVARSVDMEVDCVSSTYEVGDLLAIDEAASGTALEAFKVVKTTDASIAIGQVSIREAAAVTRVRARFQARAGSSEYVYPLERIFRGTGSNATQAAPETLSGNVVLTAASPPILRYDPAGARNLDLPAPTGLAGKTFIIVNYADAAEVITIRKTGGGATVCTPTQNETAIVWCDGVDWEGIAVARN